MSNSGKINLNELDSCIKFAVAISCFIYYLTITVATKFARDNPINKLTLLPYYVILTQSLCIVLFYGLAMVVEVDENKNKWFDIASDVIGLLWLFVIILQILVYHLISILIEFQIKTPLCEILV